MRGPSRSSCLGVACSGPRTNRLSRLSWASVAYESQRAARRRRFRDTSTPAAPTSEISLGPEAGSALRSALISWSTPQPETCAAETPAAQSADARLLICQRRSHLVYFSTSAHLHNGGLCQQNLGTRSLPSTIAGMPARMSTLSAVIRSSLTNIALSSFSRLVTYCCQRSRSGPTAAAWLGTPRRLPYLDRRRALRSSRLHFCYRLLRRSVRLFPPFGISSGRLGGPPCDAVRKCSGTATTRRSAPADAVVRVMLGQRRTFLRTGRPASSAQHPICPDAAWK